MFVFFFKQKTAYEMRISDWSSDVCSSDLLGLICPAAQGAEARWASGIPVLAAPDLVSLLNHLKGTQQLPEPARGEVELAAPGPEIGRASCRERVCQYV